MIFSIVGLHLNSKERFRDTNFAETHRSKRKYTSCSLTISFRFDTVSFGCIFDKSYMVDWYHFVSHPFSEPEISYLFFSFYRKCLSNKDLSDSRRKFLGLAARGEFTALSEHTTSSSGGREYRRVILLKPRGALWNQWSLVGVCQSG